MRQSRVHLFARVLVSWRGVLGAAAVVLAISVVLVARGSPGSSGPGAGTYVVAGFLTLLGVIVVLNLVFQLAGVDPQAPAIAEQLAADEDQQRLLTRWLERARWARFVGGLAGVLAWGLGTRMQGALLVWGFGGIAAGALAAELHHFRRPSGPRTARLDVRTVDNYLWALTAWHMVGAAAAGLVIAVLGVAVGELHVVWAGAAAAGVVGAAHLAQRRVASRPRPALPDRLRAADDLARELAIDRNLGWPSVYTALSLVAVGSSALSEHLLAVAFLGLLLQFYAIGLWWRNRRLGLDWLLRERSEPVLT